MTEALSDVPRDLVARAQHGDRSSLRALVRSAYPSVRRWALVRTGDPDEADDLTQDVMVTMIRRLGSYRGRARFSTWLYQVTRNAAADRHRRRARRIRLEGDPRAEEGIAPSAAPPTDRSVWAAEVSGLLRTFFDALPPRQREVFDLVELQGLDAAEAAARLGIAASSVRVSLLKARRALRTRILSERPDLMEEQP